MKRPWVVAVANLYLTRVIPSEYLKVYLLSIGAPRSSRVHETGNNKKQQLIGDIYRTLKLSKLMLRLGVNGSCTVI